MRSKENLYQAPEQNYDYYGACPYYNEYFYRQSICPYFRRQDYPESEEDYSYNDPNILEMRGKGNLDFTFKTDGNGNFHHEIEQYGAGVTVNIKGKILDPEATYNIRIKSSDGGECNFTDIKAGQMVNCNNIKTSFWHKTKITVDLHSTIPNSTGKATIEYSY